MGAVFIPKETVPSLQLRLVLCRSKMKLAMMRTARRMPILIRHLVQTSLTRWGIRLCINPQTWVPGSTHLFILCRLSAARFDSIAARPCSVGGQGKDTVAIGGLRGGAVGKLAASCSVVTASVTYPFTSEIVGRARVAELRESSINQMLVLTDVIATSISSSFLSAWQARSASFLSTSCLCSASGWSSAAGEWRPACLFAEAPR
jgi:hypothetical protein